MLFEKLKKEVYDANLLLKKYKLVIHTWGNVSAISENRKFFAIKPSGIAYEDLTWKDMVVLNMRGEIIDGNKKPSSDMPTHLWLYNNFENLKAIVHTHSPYAVAWSSTGEDIPCFSTTHADNFYGPINNTRELTDGEIENNYELNTGKVITSKFMSNNISPVSSPGILVKSHGPFLWSYTNAKNAVDLALTLEEIARIAYFSKTLNKNQKPIKKYLQDRHYQRKHGKNAYYGQKN